METSPRPPTERSARWRGGRSAQLPTAKDVSRFLTELRGPMRVSAVRAVLDGLFVTITLKMRGVHPLFRRPKAPAPNLDPDRSRRVSAAVDAGFNIIPVAPTCLRRSLTLLRELNRLGLTSTMLVGVRKVAGTVEAHAWVQSGSDVVNDDAAVPSQYAELLAGQLDAFLPLLR